MTGPPDGPCPSCRAASTVPTPVAAARVLVYIGAALCVLGALGSAAVAVVAASFSGAVGTVGPAATLDGGLDGLGDLAALFGTVVAVWFAFWTVVLALAAWLWFWVGSALRHGRRGARMTATVLAGLALVLAGPPALTVVGEGAGPTTLLAAMVVLAIPPALIVLLWVPADTRRHFGDPVHEHPPLPATGPVAVPPPAPAWAPAPENAAGGGIAAARCAACGADAAPTDTRCARCGLPMAAAAERRDP